MRLSKWWAAYLVGAIAVAVAASSYLLGVDSRLHLLIAAVMAAGICGGAAPGLFTTALSVLVATWLIIWKNGWPVLADDVFGLFVFMGIGVSVSLLCEAFVKARLQVDHQKTLLTDSETYRAIVEDGAALICRFRPDGILTFVNTTYCHQFGRNKSELIGQSFAPLVPDEDRPLIDRMLQALGPDMSPYTHEHRIVLGDGRVRWQRWTNRAIRNSAGGFIEYQALGIDITERRQAEFQLRELNANLENQVASRTIELKAVVERLQLAVEATGMGVWDSALPATALGWDSRLRAMWGLSNEDIELATVLSMIHADDRPSVERAMADATDPNGTGRIAVEHRIRTADGADRWVSTWGHTVFSQGNGHREPVRSVGVMLDVTERRRAEEELRASEDRFQKYIDHMPAASWLLDSDSQIVFVNRYYGRVAGVDPSTLTGKNSFDLYPPDIATQHQSNDRRVLGTGKAVETTEGYIRTDGTEGEMFVVKFPVPGLHGRMLIGGVAVDITEQRRQQEAIAEKSQVLETVLDSMGEAVLVCSADGTMVIRNRAFNELYGVQPPLASVKLQDWKYAVHLPGGKGLCPFDDLPIVRAMRGESCDDVDLEFISEKYPQALTMSVTGRPLLGAHGVSGGVVVMRDMSARKMSTKALQESEARYRSVVESLAEGIVIYDADGSINTSNDRAGEILGLTKEQIARGNSFAICQTAVQEDGTQFPGENHPAIVAMRTGKPVFNTVMGIRNPEGTYLWVTVNAVPVLNAEGACDGVVASFHDTTQARKLTEQLRNSLMEKEVLLWEIHHRVNNNLQIVSTLLDLQSSHTQDRAAIEMFRESQRRVKAMALVHERLYRTANLARVNIGEYVRQLVEDLRRAYDVKGVEVQVDVDAEMPGLPIESAITCGLLVNELVSNCFKHAFKTSGGTVRIGLCRSESSSFVLTVADDGTGFPANLNFRRTSTFGMQLIQMLVRQLKGIAELNVESGTKFTITFPATSGV